MVESIISNLGCATRHIVNTLYRTHTLQFLACPARFERATSALEVFVAAQKANNFNGLSQKTSTVQQTVQWVLSGKPTNYVLRWFYFYSMTMAK